MQLFTQRNVVDVVVVVEAEAQEMFDDNLLDFSNYKFAITSYKRIQQS